jgi:hypothetical protein
VREPGEKRERGGRERGEVFFLFLLAGGRNFGLTRRPQGHNLRNPGLGIMCVEESDFGSSRGLMGVV